MKCPKLSKTEATAARNPNSIGDRTRGLITANLNVLGTYGKEKFWKEGLKRENFIHLHNTELFNKIINVFVS